MKHALKGQAHSYKELIAALLVSNGVSVLLFVLRMVEGQTLRYWFLFWNLILAWIPFLFVWLLLRRLKDKRWLEPVSLLLTVLWLAFLPNSFYLISDLVHLHTTGEVSMLYDAVLFMSFIFNGFVAGFASLYLVHHELLKRWSRVRAHAFVGVVLLLCGAAIHLGRNLRWNSWDIIVNPFALMFDLSEQVVNPVAQSPAVVTTSIFFVLLGSIYIVLWQFMKAVAARPKR
ncbi:MAG: hypothetical protein JWL85_40 [Candidatus Saccharibacteria bacterium]|nr:hypothetical protein [Candidatus Saccharibacteria bacterium]